jgi:hypothetical protein
MRISRKAWVPQVRCLNLGPEDGGLPFALFWVAYPLRFLQMVGISLRVPQVRFLNLGSGLLVLTLLLPCLCHAQTKCPWLNQATASGYLGGDVTLSANVNNQAAGACKFTRSPGNLRIQLRISVSILADVPKQFPPYRAQCPPNSAPLNAVGNEAVTCSLKSKEEPNAECVVGRVRNQAFTVCLSSSAPDDPLMPQSSRRQNANLIAEQVAGILF